MARLREFLKWTWAIVAAAFALFAGVLVYGRRKMREGVSTGAAKQRAADDREDLRRAEEAGDDEGVLAEWRKHR